MSATAASVFSVGLFTAPDLETLLCSHLRRNALFNSLVETNDLPKISQLKLTACNWEGILTRTRLPAHPNIHPVDQLLAHYRYKKACGLLDASHKFDWSKVALELIISAAVSGNFRALRRLEEYYYHQINNKKFSEETLKQLVALFELLAQQYHGTPGHILAGTLCTFCANYFLEPRNEPQRLYYYLKGYEQFLLAKRHEADSQQQILCYYQQYQANQPQELPYEEMLSAAFSKAGNQRATIREFFEIRSFAQLCEIYRDLFLAPLIENFSSATQRQCFDLLLEFNHNYEASCAAPKSFDHFYAAFAMVLNLVRPAEDDFIPARPGVAGGKK